MKVNNAEYSILQYLHFLGSIEATEDDIVRAVKNADKYRTLDDLKRCIMNGISEMGYSEYSTLSGFKIRIPSIGECVKKAAGYIAGRIGGEKARLAVEQKVSDINREATKIAQHPVGQAIIAGGLIAATGGLGAGSLIGKTVALAGKGLSTVAAGAKAVGGAALKLGGAALKGAGALTKMAYTGVKKLGGAIIAGIKEAGKREEQPEARTVPTALEPLPTEGVAPPRTRIIDLRAAVENRKNRELAPLWAGLTAAALLL